MVRADDDHARLLSLVLSSKQYQPIYAHFIINLDAVILFFFSFSLFVSSVFVSRCCEMLVVCVFVGVPVIDLRLVTSVHS